MSQNVVNSLSRAIPGRKLLRSAILDPLVANAALILSLTVMFTVSDAFETESLAMLHSIALWGFVSLLLVLQTGLSHRLFLSFFSRTTLFRLFAAGGAVLSTTLLMTAELHYLKFTPLLPKEPDPFFEFVFFVAQPVLAAGCLTLLSQNLAIQKYVDFLQSQSESESLRQHDYSELEDFLLDNEVLRVSSQDHYLEVFCADQKRFFRGRMRDAMSVLAQREGMQIHRSHWVAAKHVLKICKRGRDVRLLLKDGAEIPVARSRSGSLTQLARTHIYR